MSDFANFSLASADGARENPASHNEQFGYQPVWARRRDQKRDDNRLYKKYFK